MVFGEGLDVSITGLKSPPDRLIYANMRPGGCQRSRSHRLTGSAYVFVTGKSRVHGCTSLGGRRTVAEVKIQDGIIKVIELDVQDPKAAAALAEYPEARWAEVMRRAIKIGLGYLKGGAQG